MKKKKKNRKEYLSLISLSTLYSLSFFISRQTQRVYLVSRLGLG